MRVGIQLYTLRELPESLPDVIRQVAEWPYDGVQFAGLGDGSPDEIRRALADTGLDVAGAHVGIDEIESGVEETVSRYDAVGCEALVVPSYESSAFETTEGAREAGQRLSRLANRLAPSGVSLHYHNHTFEFTPVDGGTAYDAFAAAAADVRLEIDTGLANHAGVDPVGLLETYGDRVDLVHLTDSEHDSEDRETLHMDLGTGDVDLAACIAAAEDAEWLLFEHGLTDHPIESARDAAETMRALI